MFAMSTPIRKCTKTPNKKCTKAASGKVRKRPNWGRRPILDPTPENNEARVPRAKGTQERSVT